MTAADWISDRRALIDAATEGPWGYQPWSAYPLPSGEYAVSILLANASPDGEIVRELPDNDGALIADARTSLPKALDALKAVLKLTDDWTERGERLMSYSETAPEEEGTSLLEAGADFVDKARILRSVITTALGIEDAS